MPNLRIPPPYCQNRHHGIVSIYRSIYITVFIAFYHCLLPFGGKSGEGAGLVPRRYGVTFPSEKVRGYSTSGKSAYPILYSHNMNHQGSPCREDACAPYSKRCGATSQKVRGYF
ncbi:MAG: hypothetical protein D6808_03210 [Candidatus Dadabacteria bacterium]|nr:MAG: hypothetical protein D6808_03210 [Candidatus Dadabacteria bacterium]